MVRCLLTILKYEAWHHMILMLDSLTIYHLTYFLTTPQSYVVHPQVQYPQSKCCRMSTVRDLPPVSGSIIWAKQIDRQLTAYMRRVEDVLGKGWESHVEGQKLKGDGDSFRLKLNTQDIFDDWARKVNLHLYLFLPCDTIGENLAWKV